MKKFAITIILSLITVFAVAQWEATNVMEHTQQGSPIFSSCLHNDAIYVATKIPERSQIIKSTDDGETWIDINYPDHVGWFSHMVSVDDRLYVANYNNWYAKSTIWYTVDDGETWVPDTAGMPGAGGANGGAYVISMHGWKGHLIATFGGADLYYMKSFDSNWKWIEELVPTDPNVYDSRGDTIFAVKKYSPDFGETWIMPANNGLPSNMAAQAIFATENRIYLAGDNLGSNTFFYSDDSGENWQSISLGQWVGQPVYSIYAIEEQLWIGINSNETTRVLYSENGGSSFVDDSEGLPEDSFGTYQITNFMHMDNTLFAANNFMDVYKKDIEINSSIFGHIIRQAFEIYPNPVRDFLLLKTPNLHQISKVQVFDLRGQVQSSVKYSGGDVVNISSLKKGTYLIMLTKDNAEILISKMIKQ